MEMNLAMTGVDHQLFKIGIINQCFQQVIPNAFIAPAAEASARVLPVSIF